MTAFDQLLEATAQTLQIAIEGRPADADDMDTVGFVVDQLGAEFSERPQVCEWIASETFEQTIKGLLATWRALE